MKYHFAFLAGIGFFRVIVATLVRKELHTIGMSLIAFYNRWLNYVNSELTLLLRLLPFGLDESVSSRAK